MAAKDEGIVTEKRCFNYRPSRARHIQTNIEDLEDGTIRPRTWRTIGELRGSQASHSRNAPTNAKAPGRLEECQAIGWWLSEHNIAQISMNIMDHDITPLHAAYEEATKDAEELSLAVTGSQIVGIVPLRAIMQVAEYYIKRDNLFILEEDQKVHLAINRLGLNSLGPFNPKERIIEYMLARDPVGPLINQTVHSFIHNVAARTAAPGGGSVSALVASLGAALATMVGLLSYGKRQWEYLDSIMRRIIPIFHTAMKEIITLIDEDSAAYNEYMEAVRLPHETEAETAVREEAILAGLKATIDVPLKLALSLDKLWLPLKELGAVVNVSTKSDIQVAALCFETGIRGAYYNVIINIDGISDIGYKEKVLEEIGPALKRAEESCKTVLDLVEERKVNATATFVP